ncbi:hypothetical protein J437_LFUL010650 [Ladona fulva]|uniref:Uncharacterized protein n=1 Tax=Ladona fulva TaxID=123851 RepID=A0A8K0KQN7_LADFU|nr:hypothetical protein J437_LFUL010650 [Ladona fulva]
MFERSVLMCSLEPEQHVPTEVGDDFPTVSGGTSATMKVIDEKLSGAFPDISGQRIFDIKFLFEKIKRLSHHNAPTNCGFSDMDITRETRKRMESVFQMKFLPIYADCSCYACLVSSTVRFSYPRASMILSFVLVRACTALPRLRSAVIGAIKFRIRQLQESMGRRVELLWQDLRNGPSHVFGEHKDCSVIGYFCNGGSSGEENLVSDMQVCGIW